LVGTSTSAVELLEVTPAGKKAMAASAWANGARFTAGESIE
jgi:methionyl-tRNA formyltransferase